MVNEQIQSFPPFLLEVHRYQKCPECDFDTQLLGVGYPSGAGFLKCSKCNLVFREVPAFFKMEDI